METVTDRGCYGLASVHNTASVVCMQCPVKDGCARKALDILTRVRKVISVEHLIERIEVSYLMPLAAPAMPRLTLEQVTTIAAMPARIQGRLRALLLQGFDRLARSRFQSGTNPFKSTGAKHLHLAGQMLLDGAFTKAEFRAECIKRYGWTKETAFSQTSQAFALLRGLDLTQEIGNRMEMK